MPAYRNLDEYLTRAGVLLTNARQNPAIAAALDAVGYDDAALQQGQTLLDTARHQSDVQRKEYGDQYGATAELVQAAAAAEAVYQKHRQLVATAYKADPARLTAFTLNESKKPSFSGWLTQARRFYANLLADAAAVTALGRYKLTRARLEQGQALVQQAEQLNAVQETEKGEAQRATRARDAALDALDDWLADFKVIAKVALADDPQLLEALQLGAIP